MTTVRLPYLVRDRDRHGTLRWYVRRKGVGKLRLRETPGSPEFLEAYRAALAALDRRVQDLAAGLDLEAGHGNAHDGGDAPGQPATPGTFTWLCRAYYASAAWRQELSARTRYARRRILDRIAGRHGPKPAAALTADWLQRFRDENADRPHAVNDALKALRGLFAWGLLAGHVRTNPAREVPYIRAATAGWHTWTIEEVRQFEGRWAVGTTARLALALLLYTGQRKADVVALGPQHVAAGWIRYRPQKTARSTGRVIEIPMLPELQRIVEATTTGHLAFLVTAFGRPFTANGFGNRFRKWCDAAGLPHCSAHGLRKALLTRLAELGATPHHIQAISGHTSLREVTRYTEAASRRGLARDAMALLAAAPEAPADETPAEREANP